MGYTTDFSGRFNLDKPLTEDQKRYLLAFAQTRRVRRDDEKTQKMNDPVRKAVNLPVGKEGGFYVVDSNDAEDVIDGNSPPEGQPGLWCQWVPTEDGMAIEWDGGEKFYEYIDWLEYIIKNFLKPWGYKLNGKVLWQGESVGDVGSITVKDNKVSTRKAKL